MILLPLKKKARLYMKNTALPAVSATDSSGTGKKGGVLLFMESDYFSIS